MGSQEMMLEAAGSEASVGFLPVVRRTNPMVREERPWGSWTVLEEGPGYKIKRLEVLPGKRMSL